MGQEDITNEDIRRATLLLKNGKGEGIHEVVSEMLKGVGETATEWTRKVSMEAWKICLMPNDRIKAITVLLCKGLGVKVIVGITEELVPLVQLVWYIWQDSN